MDFLTPAGYLPLVLDDGIMTIHWKHNNTIWPLIYILNTNDQGSAFFIFDIPKGYNDIYNDYQPTLIALIYLKHISSEFCLFIFGP